MKSIRCCILILVLSLLALSCTTTKNVEGTNNDGSPVWTTKIPSSNKLLYGVGSAKLSTKHNSEDASYANASSNLARQLSLRVDEASVVYSNDAEKSTKEAYESIKKTSVSFTLMGVVTEERWTAEDGTVWTLLSVKIDNLPKMYEAAANTYIKEEEKKIEEINNKLNAVLEELKDQNDDDSLKLKAMYEAKAESLESEITTVIKSVDYPGVRREIEKKLAEDGYLLGE